MESVRIVKDWQSFRRHLLRYHERAGVSDPGAGRWSYALSVSGFAHLEVHEGAECDVLGPGEGVLVHPES